jgi:hypothetical protein
MACDECTTLRLDSKAAQATWEQHSWIMHYNRQELAILYKQAAALPEDVEPWAGHRLAASAHRWHGGVHSMYTAWQRVVLATAVSLCTKPDHTGYVVPFPEDTATTVFCHAAMRCASEPSDV